MAKEKVSHDENKKVITDDKTIYLIRTLSRTKRKDYENYVVNAIWNRLNNNDIEVVSQQYINNPNDKRKHYFIDLYFPALKIGIEIDEAHHLKEENIRKDKEREITIHDVLHEIDNSEYFPIHIDVTKKYLEVEKQINEAVICINNKIKEVKPQKWAITPEEFYAEKSEINVEDKIGFSTIIKACNILFSTDYKESGGSKNSCFIPRTFKGTKLAGYKVWFPQLAIKDKDGNLIAPTKAGWNNQLIDEGRKIIEYNKVYKKNSKPDEKRIVFAKYKDPLGNFKYMFVGIFKLEKIVNDKRHYIKEKDNCPMIETLKY